MTKILIWLNRRLARLNVRLEEYNARKAGEIHAHRVEQGRRLATLREHLIARGVDPNDLPAPRHPDDIERENR